MEEERFWWMTYNYDLYQLFKEQDIVVMIKVATVR
jgi:hypothetical protein